MEDGAQACFGRSTSVHRPSSNCSFITTNRIQLFSRKLPSDSVSYRNVNLEGTIQIARHPPHKTEVTSPAHDVTSVFEPDVDRHIVTTAVRNRFRTHLYECSLALDFYAYIPSDGNLAVPLR